MTMTMITNAMATKIINRNNVKEKEKSWLLVLLLL
jgi:hypothetical protein